MWKIFDRSKWSLKTKNCCQDFKIANWLIGKIGWSAINFSTGFIHVISFLFPVAYMMKLLIGFHNFWSPHWPFTFTRFHNVNQERQKYWRLRMGNISIKELNQLTFETSILSLSLMCSNLILYHLERLSGDGLQKVAVVIHTWDFGASIWDGPRSGVVC